MCHNFFGWEILEIIPKNSYFSDLQGPEDLFLGSKTIMRLIYDDFRSVLTLKFSYVSKISLLYLAKITNFLEF